MMTDEETRQGAIQFAKKEAKIFLQKYCGDEFEPEARPVSVFMGGSPGAGKTEFSKSLISILEGTGLKKVVRIDPDQFREHMPGYNGKNSYLFNNACTIIVEKIHDKVLERGKNFILDSTFSDFSKARKNIERSLDLKKQRSVFIVYIFQEPSIAWEFTQKRAAVEGRHMEKEEFISKFLGARDVINRMKEEFGDQIHIWLLKKNLTNDRILDTQFNVQKIDDHIKFTYSKEELNKLLP